MRGRDFDREDFLEDSSDAATEPDEASVVVLPASSQVTPSASVFALQLQRSHRVLLVSADLEARKVAKKAAGVERAAAQKIAAKKTAALRAAAQKAAAEKAACAEAAQNALVEATAAEKTAVEAAKIMVETARVQAAAAKAHAEEAKSGLTSATKSSSRGPPATSPVPISSSGLEVLLVTAAPSPDSPFAPLSGLLRCDGGVAYTGCGFRVWRSIDPSTEVVDLSSDEPTTERFLEFSSSFSFPIMSVPRRDGRPTRSTSVTSDLRVKHTLEQELATDELVLRLVTENASKTSEVSPLPTAKPRPKVVENPLRTLTIIRSPVPFGMAGLVVRLVARPS
ncbi:LOW QUALITY PROTEIN: hypothetical protein PHMEG_00024054 [Phytophthora megakarya]|uniref:Uncharacterized protein n=1 Tax=Phytophthora megakarya TaxID=4795 RepID=A0A225VG60_9STRA|nr:LOW QUALITY PROTEIN: hypothetical protein PHMEG_00024054 [Phytophthora megakarya]